MKTKADTPSAKRSRTSSRTRRRVWLFRLLAVFLVPALLLLSVEGVLRIAGYGRSVRATVERNIGGVDSHVVNRHFGWRFFPREVARSAFFFSYPAVKDEETFRIFVLGGSAAQGDPQRAYSFSRMLSVMLEEQFPSTKFEVINTAITATNSHVVREVVSDIVDHEPDLLIVYLGNNEVVGPFGAANPLVPYSGHKGFIRTKLWVGTTKIGQLVEDVGHNLSSGSEAPRRWRAMEEFTGSQVRHDAPALQGVYRHYEENLSDICDMAADAGVPLLLSTVSVNLRDLSPFASLHNEQLEKDGLDRWNEAFERGKSLEDVNQYQAAIAAYLEASEIDAEYAELQYRLAECYRKTDHLDAAQKHYSQARDYDTLRFRADSTINEIVRNVAKQRQADGIRLVDAERGIAAHSPYKVPGREMFYEHVHFTFHGNYRLAEVMLTEVERHLPKHARSQKSKKSVLSEDGCKQRLAFTAIDELNVEAEVLRRLEQAPFIERYDATEEIAAQRTVVQKAAEALAKEAPGQFHQTYRAAIAKSPKDQVLRLMFGESLISRGGSNLKEGIEQLLEVYELGNQHFGVQAELGNALVRAGEHERAREWIARAIELEPRFHGGHYALGQQLVAEGEYGRAANAFAEAVRLNSDSLDYRFSYAMALDAAGRKAAAIEELESLLESRTLGPQQRFQVLTMLGASLASQEKFQAAIAACEKARQLVSAEQKDLLKELDASIRLYRSGRVSDQEPKTEAVSP